MENLDFLGLGSASTSVSILLAILSFVLYWGVMILKKWRQTRENFDLDFWWSMNWLPLVLSFLAAIILFIGFWAKDALTIERCLLIGSASAFFIERLSKGGK